MATCPECTSSHPPDAVVCSECGVSLPKVPKPISTGAKPKPADQIAEFMLRGASLILVLVLVALVAFVGWSIISQGIESGAP